MSRLCRLQDVHRSYGREHVLRGVDLDIQRGTILGLIGENGSGKSTLLKILAGALRPDSGTLRAERRPRIGYMPESSRWYPHLTGAQVLRYFARYTGSSADEQAALLERVGLGHARDKKVGAYSKGMRQKLGLAQALLDAPDLIILDEPTNGLDPPGILDFYEILRERAAEGVAILLSSHLLAEIEGHVTHVAFLREGRIHASGACEALLKKAGLPSRVLLRGADLALRNRVTDAGWTVTDNAGQIEVRLPRDDVGSMLALLDDSSRVDVQIRHATLHELYLHTVTSPGSADLSTNGHPTPAPQESTHA